MNITLDKNDEQLTGLLTVQLTEADYAPTVDKQIKEYTKRAQVKGFRPGMVPVGMVKKMYGKGILAEEINKMLGKAVDSYIKENNVKLLANLLPFVQPGALLQGEFPHQVFRVYWPMAQAESFAVKVGA